MTAMTPRQRMQAVWENRRPDRTPWVPSVYEHGAALLDRSPGEVSRDPRLMAEAAIRAYELYRHDLVTVGIDIYNIEAEALGCQVSAGEGRSIPGVLNHPLANAEPLSGVKLELPGPGPRNRLGVITDATERVQRAIGDEVWVYACVGGPFSQAVELRGFENLVADVVADPASVHALLEQTTALTIQHVRRLSASGAGVNLYESWATIPLIDPPMFGQFVVPYNRRVMDAIRAEFPTPPPALIMGGNITVLIDFFLQSGTSLVVADHLTDFGAIMQKIGQNPIIVRGCVDPKLIERGEWDKLQSQIGSMAAKSGGMVRFVWGCGCVTYATTPEQMLRFKSLCQAAARA